jgi:hypothetical protein
MTAETEAVRQLFERITGKSLTGTTSISADSPGPMVPDYVPDIGEVVEGLLVTQ